MQFDIKGVISFFERLFRRTPQQILSVGAGIADMLEKEAKAKAPWTDRTGMARATIKGINQFADKDPEKYCVGMCGQMPYSPKLEQGFNYRYAILVPTLLRHRDNVLENMRDIIGRQEGLN